MSIYDKASLVLIPSGTKTSKVYSQKPVSGDGDFTFSRSTAATRVNSSGNIEKETQNLLLQSNSFDTTWTNTSSTETGGQSGYDGTNNAWKLEKTGNGGRIRQAVSSSGVNTFSVYAKAGTTNWLRLLFETISDSYYFDLQNGVLGSSTSQPVHGNIESVGNGWYRCSVTSNGTSGAVRIYPADDDLDVTGTSGNIYIQDAQLEQGLVARDVITTTTTAVEGGITDNVPRLDYTDSSCPALLLEPQRTNAATNSEYLDGYTKTRVAFVQNAATSPEGVDNAVEFNDTATSGTHYFIAAGTQTNGAVLSFFAKQNTHRYVQAGPSSSIGKRVYFDLQDGVMATIGASAESYYGIEDYGNGWYRCYIEVANNENCSIFTAAGDGSSGSHNNYTGDGSGVYLYGVQVEANVSYHTSYIPTYGSAVTRSYDYLPNKSGMQNFLGTDTGTWFFHINDMFFDITGTGVGSFILTYTGTQLIEVIQDGNDQYKITLNNSIAVQDLDGEDKVAISWSSAGLVIYVNGSSVYTTTSTAYSNPYSSITINKTTRPARVDLKQMMLFPTRLTNAELADLTTL